MNSHRKSHAHSEEKSERVCLAIAQRNSGMNKAQGTTRNMKNWAERAKYEHFNIKSTAQ